ncbi:MAG: hypothetical protein K2N63_10310 [Lachnospiraceae bacterium]|nr:hypothetical protein [Lachnospiraceae bacterium]
MRIGATPENTNAAAKADAATLVAGKNGRGEKLSYREGQIIEGTVTGVDEKVSIDFSGRKLSFPKESVPGAAKGQVRRFKVLSAGRDGITLKEIGTQAAGSLGSGASSIKVDNMRILTAYEEREDAKEEEEAEGTGRLTGEDYEELCKEKYTLEGFNLTRLARAIERVKTNRQIRQEDVSLQQEKKKQWKDDVREMAERALNNHPLADYLTSLLAQADIPVTQEKIDEIADALTRGTLAVSGLKDGAKAYLIGSGLKPDITNLYKAVHSGAGKEQALPQEVWDELAPAAEKVLLEAGLTADTQGFANARWLMEHDLALTAENLIYKQELDELSMNFPPEQILKEAVDAVAGGEDAADAVLGTEPGQLYREVLGERYAQEFAQISPETVDAAVAKLKTEGKDAGEALSLSFLKQVQQMLLEGGRKDIPIADITARRQLEEIRYKLTAQVGGKLLNQGIRLDTDGLEKIVNALRDVENEYYKNLYREVGGDASDTGSVELLRAADTAVSQLKAAPAYVLGVTFSVRTIQSVESLSEAGGQLTAQFEGAMERYEALMTKPRADMGDSIRTAFRNVDEVLSGMGLEATPENSRAVRIMAYSHIELTQENLDEMKLYDAKVQELLGNLNPAACASLVKKGINPLDMPIDELNEQLSKLREEEGATTEEKYSNYLVMLDQKKELTAQERESYIGIYRLLNQVTKSDGAAIGVLAASGREITLSNLLSAVRTRRKGGVDASVDDAFGGVSASMQGKSISEQIGAAFAYGQSMARAAEEELTPEKLDAIGGAEAAMEMTAEELSRALKNADNPQEAEQFSAQRAEEIAGTIAQSSAEQTFLSRFSQERSVRTIRAAHHILGSASVQGRIQELAAKYGTQAELSEIDLDKISSSGNLQNMVEEWADSADKVIDTVFGNFSLSGADSMLLLSLQGAVRLTRNLSKQEFYEIPVAGESGFVKMNLTVMHSGGENGSVSIHFKAGSTVEADGVKVMEDVEITLKVEGQSLNGYVSTASRQTLDLMQQKEEQIRQSLMEQGFEVSRWNYGLKTRSAEPGIMQDVLGVQRAVDDSAGTGMTRTDNLYLAARTVIKVAVA